MTVSDLQQQFEEFDRDNPEVWRLFVHYANMAIASGHAHYSSDCVLHRLRWHTSVETRGDEFRLNNNFAAAYARKFEREYPQHRGFFRLRASVLDGVPAPLQFCNAG